MTNIDESMDSCSRHAEDQLSEGLSHFMLKDEPQTSSDCMLAGLPREVQLQIYKDVRNDSPKSWHALLQTSHHFSHIASTLQCLTGHVFDEHSQPKYESSDGLWPDFCSPHPWYGPSLESALAHMDETKLTQVQVLHTHCHTYVVCKHSSDKPVLFPNLRVFHSYALCSSKPPEVTARSFRGIPTIQEAPKLHTIVIHSYDALRAWQDHCQSEAAGRQISRLIINWWGRPHFHTKKEPLLQLESGASVQALHILLPPGEDTQEWCTKSDINNYLLEEDSDDEEIYEGQERGARYVNFFVNSLAKLCASEARSITIIGVEHIGPTMWRGTMREGGFPPPSERTSRIQNQIQSATEIFLSNSGKSAAEIASSWDRVKFQDLVNYAKNVNNPDELGGKLLKHLTGLQESHTPAMV